MFLRKTKGYFFIPQRSINKHIRWTEELRIEAEKCKYYKIYKYKWRWASDISSEWEAEYFHAIVYRWTIPYKRRAKWIRSWWAPQLNLLYYWIICKECSVLLVDYIYFFYFICCVYRWRRIFFLILISSATWRFRNFILLHY